MSLRWVMLGMPNTGKSTLFNRLSGSKSRVGNWPGLTIDIHTARILVGGHMVHLADLPGIHDLNGHSEDERIVCSHLNQEGVEGILFVTNATQLARQLPLVHQVQSLGIPMALVINMMDEATKLGVTVDATALSQRMGIPLVPISARLNQGLPALDQVLRDLADHPTPPPSPQWSAHALMASCVQQPALLSAPWTQAVDRILLHRVLGLPIFFVLLLLMFQLVFSIGKPIQDGLALLSQDIRQLALEPGLAVLGGPSWISGLLLDGVFNGLATVASFVPLIVLFFMAMGLVEDMGYLSRAAFLMDASMARLGLDGRSFVMMIMGMGCNVPALMGTRIIRSPRQRMLTMLIIPFSLCSARLQVFAFFIAALFSASTGPLVLLGLYALSFLTAFVVALLMSKDRKSAEPFILEMPPYRLPSLAHIWQRGWNELSHFLRRATRFILLGVILVWFLTHYPFDVQPGSALTWGAQLGDWLKPVMQPIGIDPQLTIALLFGFVAKEVVLGSLAVVMGLEGQALTDAIATHLAPTQAIAFMIFTLIYTPCVSTLATLKAESKSTRLVVQSVALGLGLAWVTTWLFYQTSLIFVS
jgi:ferrous iron transport protein B